MKKPNYDIYKKPLYEKGYPYADFNELRNSGFSGMQVRLPGGRDHENWDT
jgi:hypothetical protein